MIPITITKVELLARLERQYALAKAADTERLAEHRKEEKAWADHVKKQAKALSQMTYAQIKDLTTNSDALAMFICGEPRFSSGRYRHIASAPTCPRSVATPYPQAIEAVSLSDKTSYELLPTGKYQYLHDLVTQTFDPPVTSLC